MTRIELCGYQSVLCHEMPLIFKLKLQPDYKNKQDAFSRLYFNLI